MPRVAPRRSAWLDLLGGAHDGGVCDVRQGLGHANVRVTEEHPRGFGCPDLDDKLRRLF